MDFGQGPRPGRPPRPRVVDVMRERVEAEIEKVLEPYFRALEGAMVHSTYMGEVTVSDVADLGARIQAAERLLDRAYGKPRQVIEHAGPEGGPIRIADEAFDPKTRKMLDDVVDRIGAARSSEPGGPGTGD